MISLFQDYWPQLLGVVAVGLAVAVSLEVVLAKRNVAAAVAWIGLVWLSPFIGAFLYLLFGINRIRRRAHRLRPAAGGTRHALDGLCVQGPDALAGLLPDRDRHMAGVMRVPERLGAGALTTGNAVCVLETGAQALRAMTAEIDRAERSVALSSYIFNNDRVGQLVIAALERAAGRGVAVRVLIDGLGSLYSWPPILPSLRRRGIVADRFLYSLVPWRMPYLNLRNHQKLLMVDGRTGFTGGLNIRKAYLEDGAAGPMCDLHFRFEGPVVAQMMETFAREWSFTHGELLSGEAWFPAPRNYGPVVARGLASGPDEDEGKIHWAILAALTNARRSITIVTPYFLPDQALETALRIAAMRGLEVDIVVPARNNLPFIPWASVMTLELLLRAGCRVWLSPPPFDHTKLLVVDDVWVLLGSANWDPRSLRLNFEFNVECYGAPLAQALQGLCEERRQKARLVTLEEIAGRGALTKLRDGIARLFSPYL